MSSRGAPASARAGESAEALFPGPGVRAVSVDPSGDWIAAIAHRGEEESVVVQRIGMPTLGSVVTEKGIIDISWDGPGTLVVEAVTRLVPITPKPGASRVTRSPWLIQTR